MNAISLQARNALMGASTRFSDDKISTLHQALKMETNPNARWVLETILENAKIARESQRPMCDDTGIPHVLLEVGGSRSVGADTLESIQQGIALGMRELPCRPMAVKGDDVQRLEQSAGLDDDPGALALAPVRIRRVDEDVLRLHVLMQGGGPEIRGKTYRVFHQHKLSVIVDEIVNWATEGAALLGCTPCTPAIGIGRTHFEAASLMLDAMTFARFDTQNPIEQEITERINQSNIGPLGLKGRTTALATFLRVGPQRASGVRIVCLRLCCCMEPRVAGVVLR
ncbi:hydro-lyase, Fe-S type, tartrate/fumarate subfamily, alpha subunit [Desulfonatronospira thiodismutans ASO3-1]|uniref:Hydro-lyase, Fe-S type, tartrate/fumarate subfamily, alpha subunit n=1 Tax=Desulfonatronospira thiodismutans ASO3-1 TaxID=555779 RepID=D6SU74_9BACT|nr:fumarate hydratase [Desulfonatronospira thiodismutans]EFI32854.1 hydro-lyase, Fe-S type, tartrate/fumarate subfamily, alpha subunit [Desulfonatronospira thiodismutans ASO3-1]